MQPLKLSHPHFRLVAIVCVFLTPLARAQNSSPATAPTAANTPPLLANLTLPLDISRAKIGTHIQARVTNLWSGNGCTLAVGALVEGHVSEVQPRTKADRKSALTVVFDSAECDRHRNTPFKATVFALLGPPGVDAPNGESGMGQSPGLTDIPVNAATNSGTAAPDTPQARNSGFRSVEGASAVNQYAVPGRSIPTQWHAGMVIGVPMNLSVGAGAEGGSIIWAEKKDARLEAQTTLILMPAR